MVAQDKIYKVMAGSVQTGQQVSLDNGQYFTRYHCQTLLDLLQNENSEFEQRL
jgi:hypothetical protein